MATSTELLRAAEHMRKWAESTGVDFPWRSIESQAKRLQAIECKECRGVGARPAMSAGWCECIACHGAGTQKSKRSWPEGWPPFAVLRRAYMALGVEPRPSTLWVSRYWAGGRYQTGKQYADEIRGRWAIALRMDISAPSSP